MKNLLLASTSTIYGTSYLEYLLPRLKSFFKEASTILFIPYARPSGISYDNYTQVVTNTFAEINKEVIGLHSFSNTTEAILQAEALFVGGGNTFVLVDTLYKQGILDVLKDAIAKGTPYLGTSAGTNICGISLGTTNDMPIVQPISFTTLGVVPFNVNVHYLDPDPLSTHKGETRQTRIKEFHCFNTQMVVGLREGSWLEVNSNTIILKGNLSARIFKSKEEPFEVSPDSRIDLL